MSHESPSKPHLKPGQIAGLALGGFCLIAVLIAVFAFGGSPESGAAANAAAKNYSIYTDDHKMGDPKAPITFIEYAAPSCPFCAHFFMTVFPKLKAEYIDTGKVYFVFRTYPFMAADGAIETVARCQKSHDFFHILHHFYGTQKDWDPEYGVTKVRDAIVKEFAEIGIDEATFNQCLKNTEVQTRMNQVAQDGEIKYGVHGVPTYIINGEVMNNERNIWPKMKAKLDSLLAQQ